MQFLRISVGLNITFLNMQSQQTGTEPGYKDLVQFLPWGSLSASEQGGGCTMIKLTATCFGFTLRPIAIVFLFPPA